MTIHELAKLEGNCTDKQNADHTFQGQNYLHVYERYFNKRRKDPISLLEIGVLYGHSLNLWSAYFPKARLWGLDINPDVKQYLRGSINFVVGDQSDPAILARLVEESGGFDIVIDDGSHITTHMLASFHGLLPSMKPGSIYCIEDTRISYHGIDGGWPGMQLNPALDAIPHNRRMLEEMMLGLIKDMDHFEGRFRAIHFHSMQIVMELL